MISSLLGRLSVGHKLLLMALLPLAVAVLAGGVLVRDRLRTIDGAQQELAGLACIGEVNRTLLAAAAPDTETLSRQALVVALQLPSCARREGAAFAQALEELAREPAPSQAQLGARGQAEQAALRVEVLAQGQTLVTGLAWQSRLGASPALDEGRHVLPILVARLPELLLLAQRMDALLQAVAADMEPDGDWRHRYFMLEGQLAEQARLLEIDGQQARASAGDKVLGAALATQTQTLAGVQALGHAGRALAQAGGTPTPEALQPLLEAHRTLVVQIGQHSAQLSAPLGELLQQRIQARRTKLATELGVAVLLLLAVLGYAWAVARRVTLPLRHMAEVARAVRRNGDFGQRMEWDTRDEFGSVAQAFNLLLGKLGRHRAEQQQLGQRLGELQAQQRLVDATPLPIVVTALPAHELLHANGPGLEWIGGPRQDPWSAGLEPALRTQLQRLLAARGQVDEFEVRWLGGARPGWCVVSVRRLVYEGRDALLTVFTPVDRLKQAERGLSLWAQVFEAATEGIAVLDQARQVVSLNPALCRLSACTTDAVVGRGLEQLLAEDMGVEFIERLWRMVETQGHWQGEVRLRRRREGRPQPAWLVVSTVNDADAQAAPRRYYIASAVDISERKAQEERIRHLAHHDSLTGLPNRVLFLERLRAAVQRARQGGLQVAVLCIGLDGFKQVNDTQGRAAGDALLRLVAQRLHEAAHGGDLVCRLGGVEFAVALGGLRDGEEALRLAQQRFLPLLRRPHAVGEAMLAVPCSLGVAPCPPDEDLEKVMRRADAAMLQARAGGGDGVCLFTAEIEERAHRRALVASQLRPALEHDELTLHYQPRVAAQGGTLVGVEALLRWHSARLGAVAPAEFVPVAEESGLIGPIGAWVIDQVCRQQALWRAQGLEAVPVSINLSPLQLRDPGLPQTLREALQRHGVAPGLLELELAEGAVMDDVDATLPRLAALKALGVGLVVDDFGTGYSSVNQLHRLPIDRLKIDGSLVAALAQDPTHLAVTRAIVSLGHTLGLDVVAEGVEDEPTALALRGALCDGFQGYHYARPLPAAEVAAWMAPPPAAPAGKSAPRLKLLGHSGAA
ncbi:EAL domain-containing protein [Azohydromonas sp. G-1-1-14]|uniref:EAL domain-containing protein n=1 Tax=Azohydromonas caseinilytica TaxID=2728836 RepID=A0A848FG84_9BURK|nr:EAL domain-containing protein [Azohydromonas caseinilytica]